MAEEPEESARSSSNSVISIPLYFTCNLNIEIIEGSSEPPAVTLMSVGLSRQEPDIPNQIHILPVSSE